MPILSAAAAAGPTNQHLLRAATSLHRAAAAALLSHTVPPTPSAAPRRHPAPSAPTAAFSSQSHPSSPPPYPLAPPPHMIELRQYTVQPAGMAMYLQQLTESAAIRRHVLPLTGMFTCEVGLTLNKIIHFYAWKDYDEREAAREAAQRNPQWTACVQASRDRLLHQESRIMVEATPIYEALGMPPSSAMAPSAMAPSSDSSLHSKAATYEMRTYQLKPGYGSVPKLIDTFANALPAKVGADPEGGRLVFFGSTDVGMLNTVVELWRYNSAQACVRARQASRGVSVWREAIAQVTPGVQHFHSQLLKPLPFSPW